MVVSTSDVSHTRLNLSLLKCKALCQPCQWPLVIKFSTVVTSLVAQQLRLCCQCRECGFSPCRGTKIPHATWHGQKIEINKGYILIVSPIIFHMVWHIAVFLLLLWKSLSRVWFFATSWTVAHQAPVNGILYARLLEWVPIPFSRGPSQPRDWTQVSCIAGQILHHLSHQGRFLKFFVNKPREKPRVFIIIGF